MSNLTKLLLKPNKNDKDLAEMLKLFEEVAFFKDLNLVEDFSDQFLVDFLASVKGIFCQENQWIYRENPSEQNEFAYIILHGEVVKCQPKRQSVNYISLYQQENKLLGKNDSYGNRTLLKQGQFFGTEQTRIDSVYCNKHAFLLLVENKQLKQIIQKKKQIENLKQNSIRIAIPCINKIISSSLLIYLSSLGELKTIPQNEVIVKSPAKLVRSKETIKQMLTTHECPQNIFILIEGMCEVSVEILVKVEKEPDIFTKNFFSQSSNRIVHRISNIEKFQLFGDESLLTPECLPKFTLQFDNPNISTNFLNYLFNVRAVSKKVKVLQFKRDDILNHFPENSIEKLKQLAEDKLNARINDLEGFITSIVKKIESIQEYYIPQSSRRNNQTLSKLYTEAVVSMSKSESTSPHDRDHDSKEKTLIEIQQQKEFLKKNQRKQVAASNILKHEIKNCRSQGLKSFAYKIEQFSKFKNLSTEPTGDTPEQKAIQKFHQGKKEVENVIDSCLSQAYDFGDIDDKRRKLKNQLILQGFYGKKSSGKNLIKENFKVGVIKINDQIPKLHQDDIPYRIKSFNSYHLENKKPIKTQISPAKLPQMTFQKPKALAGASHKKKKMIPQQSQPLIKKLRAVSITQKENNSLTINGLLGKINRSTSQYEFYGR